MNQELWLQELSALEQSALVELYEIDFTHLGGEILRFCNVTNEKGGNVIWQGVPYLAYPVQGEGFELSGEGSSARPKLSLANIAGLVTASLNQYNQVLGVPVRRHLTFARFLDAVNFNAGNTQADPMQEVLTVFVIERVVSLDHTSAVFELASPAESDGSLVPSRIMLASLCCWEYRGAGCGYTGRPVADENDIATDDPAKDKCSRRITGCRARYGATAVLPIGAYISADKVNT